MSLLEVFFHCQTNHHSIVRQYLQQQGLNTNTICLCLLFTPDSLLVPSDVHLKLPNSVSLLRHKPRLRSKQGTLQP